MSYTEGQLDQYLRHINYPRDKHASDPLLFITALQARQLSRVPFESTTLHYSKHRLLSLDLDDLFQKVVIDGKGGYCMELNTFFGAVLRGLGFTLINIGARVINGEQYSGW
jgi:arylamine N-acetyltransferase